MKSRRVQAIHTTAWYLLLGGGWTLLIHVLPALLHPADAEILSAGHLAMAAILATVALLLYLIIRFRFPEAKSGQQGSTPPFPVRQAATMLLSFAVISTFILTSTLRIDDLMKEHARQKESQELESIVELKENLVSSWLRERLHDADLIGADYDIADHYSLELSGRNSGQNQAILLDRLEAIRKEYGYTNVILLDTQGQHPIYADDTHAYMAGATQSLAHKASASGNALISPLYVDDLDGDAHIDFIAPLMFKHGKKQASIGAVVIQVSIEQQLTPLIRMWPVPSRTAETLLAKRVGDKVVFLNTLRYANSKPLEYSKPLSEAKLIAAMALRDEQNVGEGVDYRGVPVLAATRRITGTPWIMVAKIDQGEVYGALPLQHWALLALSLLLVVLTGGLLLFLWRQQQYARIEHHYREMMEREALRNHYETVLRYANDISLLADSDGRIVDANMRASELTGYNHDELLGMHTRDLHSAKSRAAMDKQWQFDEQGSVFEAEFMRKDDATFPVEVSARIIEVEGKQFRQAIIRDITERKRAEDDLRKSEQAYRTLATNLPGLVYRVLTREGNRMQFYNDMFTQLTGYPETEMTAGKICSIEPLIVDEDHARVVAMVRDAAVGKRAFVVEYRLKQKHDGIRWMEEHGMPVYGADGALLYIDGVIFDITKRKTAEKAIRVSRDLLRSVLENVPVRVFWKDKELHYLGCNTAFAKDAGMSHPKQLYGKDDFQMGWKDQAELYRADDMAVIQSGEPRIGFEEPQTTPDGQTIWLRTSKVPLRNTDNEITGMLGIYEDITAHKQAQDSLRHLNRALKTLSSVNHTLVHAQSEEELWQGVCRAAVEEGGYLLAWIGYAEENETKSVRVMASHAVRTGYTNGIRISWDDVPEGRGPTGMAIRTGKSRYIQDIEYDPAMAPWQENALAYGYKACIALPLFENGKPFGVLTIYAAETDAFNDQEIALLEEMAGELDYGIHMLRTGIERDLSRAEQQQTLKQMQQGLVETVEAIASTVEMRDPYTAGHQRRVAEIAVAIARKLGMEEEQIRGLFLAGIVHDLGKIGIPAEILSYPGRLSETQFMMVQEHSQIGFDILKDVHFPWPIAQMVLQHHERLDGSGYPQGLKGEEILREAQILSVADVVEAMASHRPYRAGLGLDAALAEINDKRGTLFEADVVDACTSLFREDGFELPT
ncbi:PAS domain S-box protein [Mariprofundus ferrooxydans]|uniref:Sensory box protein n=1 Tax=Mariprofundus ferrooxydans PV-1 TaxID=314345 RepID=Q0F1H9_9PROT|nr:PAS domain S-box protein [Mariprofundus ferrooxydans]EAU55212.1 sensory box protein [Mariprofundus ferrooxydans PV-1]